jgi:ABC-type multidrug transport system fused ATPase/permease subunit
VQILGAIILVLVYVGLTLILSWQMTLAVLIVSALVIVLLGHRTNRGTEFGQDITQVDAEIHREAEENLTAAKLVKASSGVDPVTLTP